jgi:hypothetical protein
VAVTEQAYLNELWAMNICPYCSKAIPEGTRVGSGRKSDGGFCSLDCYAKYHAAELAERARRAAGAVKKQLSVDN